MGREGGGDWVPDDCAIPFPVGVVARLSTEKSEEKVPLSILRVNSKRQRNQEI